MILKNSYDVEESESEMKVSSIVNNYYNNLLLLLVQLLLLLLRQSGISFNITTP